MDTNHLTAHAEAARRTAADRRTIAAHDDDPVCKARERGNAVFMDAIARAFEQEATR